MVVTLNATVRAEYGKDQMKKLRAGGKLPAVAYGPGLKEPLHLALDAIVTRRTLTDGGKDAEYELVIGSNTYPVLLQEVQRHPVTGDLLHLDFYIPEASE